LGPMTDSSRGHQQFFAELKRRHVFKVAAVYGVVAFGLLQVAEPLAIALGLPDTFLTYIVAFLLIGFPVALVLAWAFEVTPNGVQRTESAEPEEIAAIVDQPMLKRWMPGLLAVAGAALLFGGWWMGQRSDSDRDLNLSVPEAQASEFRRIAVLPFEDLGGNEENDPFLSGIHVDIHGKLMGVSDLRVTSLMSVHDYAASETSTSQIANELVVDYLLRGSVRRVGNQARVNVQLTDVTLAEDIWAQEFDREITAENLFAIQSEIARRVANELQARLSPEEVQRLEAGLSTDNLAAINAYHRVRALMVSPRQETTWEDLLGDLERAVELAPEFVEAWSGLAMWRSVPGQFLPEYAADALVAVERTEALAPGSLEAIKARAAYSNYVEKDHTYALELMRRAEVLAPSDAEVLEGIGRSQVELGQDLEGARTMKRAADLDPKSSMTLTWLGRTLFRQHMWSAARGVLERALALDTLNAAAQGLLVSLSIQGDGDPRAALSLANEFGMQPSTRTAWIATLARDYDEATRILGAATDPDSLTANYTKTEVLAMSIWVEHKRRGNAQPLRDSLSAHLDTWPLDSASNARVLLHFANARLMAGEPEEGWALWEEATSKIDEAGGRFVNDERWQAARIAADNGRPEEAFALLDDAVARPSGAAWSVVDLELDPRWDALRSDPRFDDLIDRQRAYEEEQARLAEAEGPWLP
jgi:TolB-like protein/Flp pilus assembly protein TadD